MKKVHVRAYDKKDEKTLNSKAFKKHVDEHGGKFDYVSDKGVAFTFDDHDKAERFHRKNQQHFGLGSDLHEEAPANAAGGGGVAGIGVGQDGEPGVTPNAQKKYQKKNKAQAVIPFRTFMRNAEAAKVK